MKTSMTPEEFEALKSRVARDALASIKFKSSFDYKTTQELVDHLREHANREAGGNPSDDDYDPETLAVEHDAADEIDRLQELVRVHREAAVARLDVMHELQARIDSLEAEIKDRAASFELRWGADRRAIKRWQDATGHHETWPDHADLCVWLLGELDRLRAI